MSTKVDEYIALTKRMEKGLEMIDALPLACTKSESNNLECSGCFLTDRQREAKKLIDFCRVWKTWIRLKIKLEKIWDSMTGEEREQANG